jgi:hypothetical protein
MTDFTLMPDVANKRGDAPSGPPPINPPWLRPAAIVGIVAAHLAVFGAFLRLVQPAFVWPRVQVETGVETTDPVGAARPQQACAPKQELIAFEQRQSIGQMFC